MKVSIIVPCFNEEQYIEKVIHSINSQTYTNEKEIIVVDDNSTDGTKEKLIKLKNLKKIDVLINHKINQGKGAAIRSAIKEVKGDIIIKRISPSSASEEKDRKKENDELKAHIDKLTKDH